MHKRLRILVPTIQVLAFIATRVLMRLSVTSDSVNFNYSIPAQDLITRLNYPLALFWFSVVYAIDRLPLPDPNPGLGFTALALVAGIVFLASVALFWYLVVREIELRLQGKSLLRFSSRFWSFVTILVLFCLGAGALISGYLDGLKQIPFMLRNGSAIGLFLTILTDMFVLAWGITLTGMSVSDFRNFVQSHGRTLSKVGGEA
jgi:hypothetical protein